MDLSRLVEAAPDAATVAAGAETLRRRLARAERRVELLDDLIERRTRSLYTTQQELRRSADFVHDVLRTMDNALLVTGPDGHIISLGGSATRLLGRSEEDLLDVPLCDLLDGVECAPLLQPSERSEREVSVVRPDGKLVPILLTTSAMTDARGEVTGLVHVATDLTERKRLESDLRQAQKLESIGQLAAGVAHEINTPVQFVGDSTRFLGDVLVDLLGLVDACLAVVDAVRDDPAGADLIAAVDEAADLADLDFVRAEAPAAVERTVAGVRRVSEIVAALKQFAHPGGSAAATCDLNDIITSMLVVASNEYKYVADVVTDLHPVPTVLGDRGDLGQVVLNLVVNAAHAIADRPEGGRGTITVRTASDGDRVVLEVADTGTGIPPELVDRIFDPFFTTKEVGRGTGQGLPIVRSVVDRHHGTITVDTTAGAGTTFRVSLPVESS